MTAQTKTAIKIILLNVLLVFSLTAQAQSDVLFENVENALSASSSRALAKHLYTKVELKIDGQRKEYSSKQAEAILKQFFQENNAIKCEFVHNGQNNAGGIVYAIGNYETSANNFRVVVRAKQFDGAYKLYRIEFTKER